MKEPWLNKLKERSEKFELEAPSGLWESIQHSLANQQSVSNGNNEYARNKTERKSAAIVRLWRYGVAAAVLLGVIAFVALHDDNMQLDDMNKVTQTSQSATANSIVPGNSDKEEVIKPLIAENHISSAEQDKGYRHGIEEKYDRLNTIVVDTAVLDVNVENISKSDKEINKVVNADTVADRSHRSVFDNIRQRSTRQYSSQGYKTVTNDGGYHKGKNNGKWSMDLYASNMSGNSSSSFGYRNFTLGANPFNAMPKQDTWTTGAMANIMFNNLDAAAETKINHHLPLHVGALVRYDITGRWGIESGLAYTLLKSELTSGGERDYYATEQSLHYLGIPLNVSYTIWESNHLRLYVSAGGMMEIPLSGKTATNYVNNGSIVDSEQQDVDIDKLQWSVSGSAGLQYNFIDWLGVYVEPGVKYYFDDGSDVLTIYKDKPLNFSLQFGLRFTLN